MKGKLIVFEGGEGSGKTTQLQKAVDWLLDTRLLDQLTKKGHFSQLLTTREPGGTSIGLDIRNLLLNFPDRAEYDPIMERAELLMYAADRAQHVEAYLRPHLEGGALILCDRYTPSTVAYQGYGRGIDLSLINPQLNDIATGGIAPDLTIWLDVDPAEGLRRARQKGEHDRIEQADLSFHQRVREGYQALSLASDRFFRIDANRSEEMVAHDIKGALVSALSQWCQFETIGKYAKRIPDA